MGFIVSKTQPELGATFSVNTTQFDSNDFFLFVKVDPVVVLPPDPIIYWINEPADNLREMTQPEKDVVDAAIEAARIQSIEDTIIALLSIPPTIQALSEASTSTGLTITTNVTDLIVDDMVTVAADSTFEKFFRVVLILNIVSSIFSIKVFERTSAQKFNILDDNERQVLIIDNYQLDAAGATLTKL